MVEVNRSRRRPTRAGSSSTATRARRTTGSSGSSRSGTGSRSGWSTRWIGDHPMHHPFHIHGAGRFLVLARDGQAEPNLMWKDTVLVRTGEIVDILLDVTNLGLVDGALPHRRAPRERHDVQLQRRPGRRRVRPGPLTRRARFDVVVVGGGQAGLAIGYLLAQQRRRFTILEAADTPAAAWRERWDSCGCSRPSATTACPGRCSPGTPTPTGARRRRRLPRDYARRFELPVELGSRVRRSV